jgi:hypothetical protein
MSHRTPHRPVLIQALRRLRRDSSSSDQARQPNHRQKARPDGVTRASASERNRRPSRTSPRRQQERASYWRCPDPVVLRRPATRNPSATSSTKSAIGWSFTRRPGSAGAVASRPPEGPAKAASTRWVGATTTVSDSSPSAVAARRVTLQAITGRGLPIHRLERCRLILRWCSRWLHGRTLQGDGELVTDLPVQLAASGFLADALHVRPGEITGAGKFPERLGAPIVRADPSGDGAGSARHRQAARPRRSAEPTRPTAPLTALTGASVRRRVADC